MKTKFIDIDNLLENLGGYGVKQVMIGLRRRSYKAVFDIRIERLKKLKAKKVRLEYEVV